MVGCGGVVIKRQQFITGSTGGWLVLRLRGERSAIGLVHNPLITLVFVDIHKKNNVRHQSVVSWLLLAMAEPWRGKGLH